VKLHDDWRWIVSHAWSIRFIALAALLSGFEVILPLYSEIIPRGLFAILSFAVTAAALVARIVAQAKDD
jgi:hypothetical protein